MNSFMRTILYTPLLSFRTSKMTMYSFAKVIPGFVGSSVELS